MKIVVVSEGKKHRFRLPLNGFFVKLVLKLALRVRKDGKGGNEKSGLTEREKRSVIACAGEMTKELKAFRRRYGKLTVLEATDGKDAVSITV